VHGLSSQTRRIIDLLRQPVVTHAGFRPFASCDIQPLVLPTLTVEKPVYNVAQGPEPKPQSRGSVISIRYPHGGNKLPPPLFFYKAIHHLFSLFHSICMVSRPNFRLTLIPEWFNLPQRYHSYPSSSHAGTCNTLSIIMFWSFLTSSPLMNATRLRTFTVAKFPLHP
jgi:hypothetical protein